MPASVRGRDRRVRRRDPARRPDRAQRPVRGRHAPQRRHARGAVLRRTARSSGGRRTARTTPTSAAWRPARCRPTRSRSTQEGLRLPPVAPRRRRRGGDRRALAHARRAARRPRRAAGREPARRRAAAPSRRVARVADRSTRSSTTASAGCAPRSRRCPTARGAFDDVLDSAGPRPRAADTDARSRSTLTVDGDDATFDFTGTDAQRPGNVNAVEAVTVERGRVRAARGDRSDDPGERRRDAARCA